MHRPVDPHGELPTLPLLVAVYNDPEYLYEADSPAGAVATVVEVLTKSDDYDSPDIEDEDLALRMRSVTAKEVALKVLPLRKGPAVLDLSNGQVLDPSPYGANYSGALTDEEKELAQRLEADDTIESYDDLPPEQRLLMERYEHQQMMNSGVTVHRIDVSSDRAFLKSLAGHNVITLAEAPGSHILRAGGPWTDVIAPSREGCAFFHPTFRDPERWNGDTFENWCDQFAIAKCDCAKCPGFAPKGEPQGLPAELAVADVMGTVPGVVQWPPLVGEEVLRNREVRERRRAEEPQVI